MPGLPAWAEWHPAGAAAPWTVGVEEEVMLLDPRDWSLASRIDDVLPALSRRVAEAACAETHGSTIELTSRPHATAAAAGAELAELRARLLADLAPLGLCAAVAGMHPFTLWTEVQVSGAARHQMIHDAMRELARREPTYALHVHVAVPDGEAGVRALRGLREHVPLLLAVSANSPFWQGRDTGLASARVPVFDAFPRVGIPRAFGSYAEYVETVDVLLRCDAISEPTFLWWDVRLQPRLGTVEVRIMDAQTRAEDNAALAAVVQCLVRLEATADATVPAAGASPEVLAENRFLATRDGLGAAFVHPAEDCRRPARDLLDEVLLACGPHAAALDCERELAGVTALAGDPGAERQRNVAGVRAGRSADAALRRLVGRLAADFTPVRAVLEQVDEGPREAPASPVTRWPGVTRAGAVASSDADLSGQTPYG